MNCSSVNSSINHENINYNVSSMFKQVFNKEQEDELNNLEKKLNTYKGEKESEEKRLFYNYLYATFYLILFIVLFSLLFTSYFNKKSSNTSNTSLLSNNDNLLNKL